MHVPKAKGRILSLKVLAQKGFESHILWDRIQITKDNKTYTEALLVGELYEAKMRVIPPQENILSAVKRDTPAADLHTWHRRLGHLGDSILKGLVGSSSMKGMSRVRNSQASAGTALSERWMRDHLKIEQSMTHDCLEPFMPT